MRLDAPAAVAAATTLRRVNNDNFSAMIILDGETRASLNRFDLYAKDAETARYRL